MIRNLWRLAIAGMGTAMLAAGLVVATTSAGATAEPTVQVAADQVTQVQQQPAVAVACTTARNYLSDHATFTYCGGSFHRTGCSAGNNGSLNGPLYAANGCTTQLYLWLTHTLSGTPDLCVNPQSSTNTLKRYYEEFEVTNHTGNC